MLNGTRKVVIDGLIVEHTINGKPLASFRKQSFGPVPFDQWPIWARALRQLSIESDKGIGDTVARIIGNENSLSFQAWFESTFKKKCGCTGRQTRWNNIYSLKNVDLRNSLS